MLLTLVEHKDLLHALQIVDPSILTALSVNTPSRRGISYSNNETPRHFVVKLVTAGVVAGSILTVGLLFILFGIHIGIGIALVALIAGFGGGFLSAKLMTPSNDSKQE